MLQLGLGLGLGPGNGILSFFFFFLLCKCGGHHVLSWPALSMLHVSMTSSGMKRGEQSGSPGASPIPGFVLLASQHVNDITTIHNIYQYP